MLRKIILPLVLLIFTQQELYGMKEEEGIANKEDVKAQFELWGTINSWVNIDNLKKNNQKLYPRLWWLWAILDNVPLQYGNSKIWKHGEAYYGLSNGIGFFLSFLNFGWLKIGIGDIHINVINAITNYIKIYVYKKYEYYDIIYYGRNYDVDNYILWTSLRDCLLLSVIGPGIHLLSLKFYNFVKIKIISLVFLVGAIANGKFPKNKRRSWYLMYATYQQGTQYEEVSKLYLLLSPRIEINIAGIINYFKGK